MTEPKEKSKERKYSHAHAIAAADKPGITLARASDILIDQIDAIIRDTGRCFDEYDPQDQPCVFSNKLSRWAETTRQIAVGREDEPADPFTALQKSFRAVISWAVEYDQTRDDWVTSKGYGKDKNLSILDLNADAFRQRKTQDPIGSARRAMDEQRNRALLARTTAIETFTNLATEHKAMAVAFLDRPRMMTFDQCASLFEGVLDLYALRTELLQHVPAGSVPDIQKPQIQVPDHDFY